MSNYKEIVTKAVVSKGKKLFTTNHSVEVNNPSTILGCWVINHNFNGTKSNNNIVINGSYDVNIWYSYDNDTKTDVVKETNTYKEVVHMRNVDDIDGEEIIVRSLKQPNPLKVEISGNSINYSIEKELGIELVGDVKVKIAYDNNEDPWDNLSDSVKSEDIEKQIDEEVKEEYLD